MPVDFGSFKKMDGLPAIEQLKRNTRDGPLLLLVRLNQGAQQPSYLVPRAWYGDEIFSAQVTEEQMSQLEKDPAVASFEVNRPLGSIG